MVFNFPLMKTNKITPAWVRANQAERLAAIPPNAWPCNTLGNHDSPRLYSRYGDGIHDVAIARLNLALMLTLKGTPFLYYGEEIGMTDLILENLRDFRDQWAIWTYETEIEQLGSSPEAAFAYAARASRDKCRTPMQWANRPNAGFSPESANPWLPVNPNYVEGVNVADQAEAPESLLNFYRQMLRVRKNTPALIAGDYRPLAPEAEGILSFLRSDPASRQVCLVILNMMDQAETLHFDLGAPHARLVFSNRVRSREIDDLSHLVTEPFEIYIGELIAE